MPAGVPSGLEESRDRGPRPGQRDVTPARGELHPMVMGRIGGVAVRADDDHADVRQIAERLGEPGLRSTVGAGRGTAVRGGRDDHRHLLCVTPSPRRKRASAGRALVTGDAHDPQRDRVSPAVFHAASSACVPRSSSTMHGDRPLGADRQGVLRGVHGIGVEVLDEQDRGRARPWSRRRSPGPPGRSRAVRLLAS